MLWEAGIYSQLLPSCLEDAISLSSILFYCYHILVGRAVDASNSLILGHSALAHPYVCLDVCMLIMMSKMQNLHFVAIQTTVLKSRFQISLSLC